MQILNSLRIAQSARYLGTTQFAHNERGERTSLTDPAGNTVDYTHNAFGEQTALNNRRSQTYQFTFDANGNPLATVTPLGHTTTRAYNDLGQVESVGEASGQTTTFVYDDAGRVESQTDPAGTITTSFDDNGNPLTVTEGGDVLTRTFDEMDRVATYTDAAGNQIAYQRDLNGNLTQITYPGGETVTYTYDAHDRLKTVSDWSGRTTTYTWDAAGRLIGISRPNGTSRVNEYTDADDLDRFYEYGPGQSTLHAYARFGYDLDSRIDWRYRLPQPREVNLPNFDATYDIDNRVATWNGAPVTHDADGNMTSGPLPGEADFVSYNFDARNRLTAVNGTSYQYDAEGNRIAKTTAEGTTSYVIDPHGDALPRVLVRTKPDGSTTRYIYGIGLLYEVDESDVATYYHFDQSGSTIAMTDTSGSVTDRVEYSSFGAITHREGTTDTPYLYAGQFGIQAEANGLLYMRARYYSPQLQRFINGDPARFDGGLNWYAYANNSPLMYVDPDGEVPILAAVLVGAAIGALVDSGITTFMDVRSGEGLDLANTFRSAFRGAITGAISTIATPATGSFVRGLSGIAVNKIGIKGVSGGATGKFARRLSLVNTGIFGGGGGQIAFNATDPSRNLTDGLATSVLLGTAGQGIGNRFFPTVNMNSIRQFNKTNAFTKKPSRLFSRQNSRNFSGSSITSSIISGGSNFK